MFWLLALLAYLLGSLSFAIVLSRLAGSPDRVPAVQATLAPPTCYAWQAANWRS